MRSTVQAISRATRFLRRSQLPHGEFATFRSPDARMDRCHFDSSPFVTANVLYSTQFVEHAHLTDLRRRGREFLLEEMEAPGVWRFFSSRNREQIDPDLDDTCLASLVLRGHVPGIGSGRSLQPIMDNRDEHGLFRTWLRHPDAPNDVDSVVVANVVAYLGERPETTPAIDHLKDVILGDREKGSYLYYLGDLALYHAVSRALHLGVSGLAVCRTHLVEKIGARQRADGGFGDELGTGYAVCALANLGYPDRTAIERATGYLLERQAVSGAWPRVAAWSGPPTPHLLYWGSEELTTAIVLEALARAGPR